MKIEDILSLKNTTITYKDGKLYDAKYEQLPDNYGIILTDTNLDGNFPFTNSFNKTLFFSACLENKAYA
jgi:hypothetical protein